MLWRVLGPLEVWAGGGWVGVDEPKRRALVAALLVASGKVVPAGQLIDELWGEDPPSGARKLLSNHVSRLRRFVGDPAGEVVVTRAPGYLLPVSAADVDAGRFEELLAGGRAALEDGDAERAARTCAEALALWRGPALADVPRGPMAATEADRLEELRLAATELWIDAELNCGRAARMVAQLRRLVAAHPLRERCWHQLMRALDGSGRPAEALAAYEQVRQIIARELGADPGHDLQQLHRRLLAGPAMVGGAPQNTGPTPEDVTAKPAVPRQLPAPVRLFAGRVDEMRRLSRLLDEAADAGGAMVISAVGGTAGVGKTALAVYWAHQVADRFPDGQLYMNLRGYDPGQPVSAADALAGFLRALGVPGKDIPADTEERAARYRSLLAGRQMLVVLDNASEVDQVRPAP